MDTLTDWFRVDWRAALEIAIIWVCLYGVISFLRGTRGEGILKGLAALGVLGFLLASVVIRTLRLEALDLLLAAFLQTSVFALIIIFQPELRHALVRLGQMPFLQGILRTEPDIYGEIADAAARMAKNRVGALIALEREVGLGTYVDGGVRMTARVSAKLLETIFFPGSPLHDGAVVIQDARIAAASCLFPLTENPSVSRGLGTRHRAAIGLSEETDAVVVVVSEQTGGMSISVGSELRRNLDRDELHQALRALCLVERGPNGKTEPAPSGLVGTGPDGGSPARDAS